MSPHAVDDVSTDPDLEEPRKAEMRNSTVSTDTPDCPNLLHRINDQEVHDLICVGFGPASLAIAVALYDAVEGGLRQTWKHSPKVRFLERQPRFTWHAGMMLAGAKMQISFIKDLATLRNPRSKFTFLNYLHSKARISAFSNLGTFLPERIEFEDYMRWCADHFENVVDYYQEVQAVESGTANQDTGKVDYFQIRTWDWKAEKVSLLRARHVAIAVGGEPNIPKGLDIEHPYVIHSSRYAREMANLSHAGFRPKSVAIVGAGQSAAEVFCDIPSRFPDAKAHLLIRGSALRPSDDSPFVNEIFDPDRIDDIYSQEPDIRARLIAKDKATNYSVVRLELLERIYSSMYAYRIQYRSERDWPQQIWTHREVTGVDILPKSSKHALSLRLQNTLSGDSANNETLGVDLVIIASGYQRNAHKRLLKPLNHLIPDADRKAGRYSVNREYNVRFDEKSVASNIGIWLQGCNESTHGLSDSLLSLLAVRGGEVVQSIFGE